MPPWVPHGSFVLPCFCVGLSQASLISCPSIQFERLHLQDGEEQGGGSQDSGVEDGSSEELYYGELVLWG